MLLLLAAQPGLARETWPGTAGTAWPSQWTSQSGTNTQQAAGGQQVTAASAYAAAREDLTGMSAATDTDVTVDFIATSSGVEQYAVVSLDGTATVGTASPWAMTSGYQVQLNFNATSTASNIGIYSTDSTGTQTTLGGGTLTKTLAGATTYHIRVQRIGTALSTRVWTGSIEPATWDLTATVSSPPSGKVALATVNGGDGISRTGTWSNLLVTNQAAQVFASSPAFSGSGSLNTYPGAVQATEDWTGTNGAAWPGQWTYAAGAGSYNIQSNQGQLTTGTTYAYGTERLDLQGIPALGDTDMAVDLSVANAGEQYVQLIIDSDQTGSWVGANSFRAQVYFDPNPALSGLTLTSCYLNTDYSVASVGKTLSPGVTYRARVQLVGTTLSAKVWDPTGPEPQTWDVTGTVSSPPFTGRVSLAHTNGADSANRTATFDNLRVNGTVANVAFTGSASLSGSGTLGASATPGPTSAPALSGAGTLATAGTPSVSGTAGLSGSGTLTTTGTPGVATGPALAGSGALSASSTPGPVASTALSGSGTLTTGSGAPNIKPSLALSGSGTLTTADTPAVAVAAALSGSGSLTTARTLAIATSVALAGAGTLTTTGSPGGTAGPALSGAGALAVGAASPAVPIPVSLSGSGTLNASAGGSGSSTPALAGSGTLTTTGAPNAKPAVALSGSGTLTVTRTLNLLASPALSGSGVLSTTGTPVIKPAVALSGSGVLGVTSSVGVARSVGFTGSGTLTTIGSAGLVGALGLSGSGSLSVSAGVGVGSSAGLTGTGTLSLTASYGVSGSAALSGAGSLTVRQSQTLSQTVALSGAGLLVALGFFGKREPLGEIGVWGVRLNSYSVSAAFDTGGLGAWLSNSAGVSVTLGPPISGTIES